MRLFSAESIRPALVVPSSSLARAAAVALWGPMALALVDVAVDRPGLARMLDSLLAAEGLARRTVRTWRDCTVG